MGGKAKADPKAGLQPSPRGDLGGYEALASLQTYDVNPEASRRSQLGRGSKVATPGCPRTNLPEPPSSRSPEKPAHADLGPSPVARRPVAGVVELRGDDLECLSGLAQLDCEWLSRGGAESRRGAVRPQTQRELLRPAFIVSRS
jgi:hypothetical protein